MKNILLSAFFLLTIQMLSAQTGFYIKFPADEAVQSCTDTSNLFLLHPPIVYNPDSLPLAITQESEIYLIIYPYFCYRIERTWTVRDTLHSPTPFPCIHVPNPIPPSNYSPDLSVYPQPAAIVSAANAPAPWEPTIAKVYFQDSVLVNYSQYWSDTASCYTRKQYIFVRDTQPPAFSDCPASVPVVQDTTANDPQFWKASYWNNPENGSHDLGEFPIDLGVTGSDACEGPSGIGYFLYLDLDGDGIRETVVRSDFFNEFPGGFLRYNNRSDNYTGGELREFDQRAVPTDEKYRFTIQHVIDGNVRHSYLRWATKQNPNQFVVPQLPPGVHRIHWCITDNCGNIDTCYHNFIVQGNKPIPNFSGVSIRFPDDIYQQCQPGQQFGVPKISNPTERPLTITYEDSPTEFSPNCVDFTRKWLIYNTETFNPNVAYTQIPNPNPKPIVASPENLAGPVLGPSAALSPWNPSLVKLYPTDAAATDYSTFWDKNANAFKYDQRIRVFDMEAPDITNCPAANLVLNDSTDNDPALWNADYWEDHSTGSHDLTETTPSISVQGSDVCTGANVQFRYLLFLDLDQDGKPETVVNSNAITTPGFVLFGNINTLNYQGGELRKFDQRNVAPEKLYQFGVRQSLVGNERRAEMIWYSGTTPPVTDAPVQLPPGAHTIKWFLSDGCGNENSCQFDLTVPFDSTPIVPVHDLARSDAHLYAHPNPFHDKTLIALNLSEPETVVLKVFDQTGRLVLQQENQVAAGAQHIPLNLPGEPGLLYVSVQSANVFWVQKLIRQ
ncbi:MAG: T9SS type A sorting domain-containing protein [Bacteroidota bacterium]